MTTRRRLILLAATIAVATAVGGVVYSRTRGPAPDDSGAKADDTPPPAPVTKATTPARRLNEKEQMLVGKWKLEKSTPPIKGYEYQATIEYAADGTFLYRCSAKGGEPWSVWGTYQVVGDVVITNNEGASGDVILSLHGGRSGSANLIEELSEGRMVKSAPDGINRSIVEWSRIRQPIEQK